MTTPAPDAASSADKDAREYLSALVRYRWLLLGAALLGTGVAWLWTQQQTRIYRSTATLEYVPNPVRPLGSDVEDIADPVGDFLSTREFIETQNRVMQSRAVLTRVVERLALHESPGFFGLPEEGFRPRTVGETTDRLRSQVYVEQIKNTRLADLRVEDSSPDRAKLLADTVLEVFIEKALEDRLASTVQALEWLVDQLDDLRSELEEAELALHDFKMEHNVLSVSMEDRQNIVAQELQSLSAAISEAQQKRIVQQAHLVRLREIQREGLPVDSDDGGAEVVEALRSTLREKRAERTRLSFRYGSEHPEMVAVTTELQELETQIAQELESMVRAAGARLGETRRIEAGLRAAISETQNAGLVLNLREIEFERLARERTNREKLYQQVLTRTTETNLTRMINTSHVRLVDEGTVATTPVSPKVPQSLAAGALMGMLVGLLLTLGIQRLDNRLRRPDQVEELGIVLLGTLPRMEEALQKVPEPERLRVRDRFILEKPQSSLAESCRTIRTNLTFMAASEARTAFVVTSPAPREGKSTVACNLAIAIAQSGHSVLLVDTDLRRPRLHRSWSAKQDLGISNVLVGEASFDEVPIPTEVEGLDLVVCGPVPPNPAELLHTAAFDAFLSDARARYDRVIFDSPPLGVVSDAAVIAKKSDGAILVAKSMHTTREGLRGLVRRLRDVNATILGAVVNDLDVQKSSHYGAYYQYYRREGYYGPDPESDTSQAAE
ncbi:MAG: polysaccharide biosynthesis tyrosine autokinase [Myxococcota bacterium]